MALFFDPMKTRSFFTRLLRSVAAPVDSSRTAERKAREAIELCHALLSERGEVSGAALARAALAAYGALPANPFKFFIDLLARDFSPPPAKVASAVSAYASQASTQNLVALQR